VERCVPYQNSHLLKLKGIDTLARADALAGREIFVPGAALRPLEGDRVYDADLIGCGVVDPAGSPVGTVKDVVDLGESTLLVIERPAPGGEVLIPLSRSICVEIDLVGRRIVVDAPDGLFELNEI
jgi:16S rRNA processing protein RimM